MADDKYRCSIHNISIDAEAYDAIGDNAFPTFWFVSFGFCFALYKGSKRITRHPFSFSKISAGKVTRIII